MLSNHFSMSFSFGLRNGSIILKPDTLHLCSKAGSSWNYLFQGVVGWSYGNIILNSLPLDAVEALFVSSWEAENLTISQYFGKYQGDLRATQIYP